MIDSVVKNKIYLILAAIVLLAGILRFYKIDQVPVSLYWDEVSSAYNAYSIVETGKDEFGTSFPLLFRAFEDYKTPANIYLTAIPVKFFGLNEFSARFTSAFLGTLTVLITFFLIKELVRKKEIGPEENYIALLTAFLVAISPWHIQFSRTGFEANSGLFFVVFGAFLFFKFINSNLYKFFFGSMFFFALSIYFYRSIWVFVPLLLFGFFIIYQKVLFARVNLKKTLLGILIFLIMLVPFVPLMFSREGLVRVNQVAVFYNSQEKVYESAKKQEQKKGIIGTIVYNRRVVYLKESISGYLAHYSPNFFFFAGDGNGRHGVSGIGNLYAWGILFIIPGIYFLFKLDKKTRLAIIAWILIAPIPAAISVPSPHSLRSLNMIPIPQLLLSFGIFWFFLQVKQRYRPALGAILIGLMLFFFIKYVALYYGENAIKTSADWGDGHKQLTSYIFENENDYDKIIVSGHYWQPYIYFLFYKKYDPKLFQERGNKAGFDKYIFGGTSWDMNGKELGDRELRKLSGPGNVLVALSPVEYSFQKKNIDVSREIKNHNNELVFIVGKLR